MMGLALTELGIAYTGKQVLKPVTTKIEPGLIWLTGRNGSGKSTLLRTLAGGQSDYDGIIMLNGIEERKHPVDYRRQLFFSPSDALPLPWLTPEKWSKLTSQLFPNFCIPQWQYWLSAFSLSATERLPLDTLSLGTRRKHQHAITLSSGCAFLVFDEPYNALDAEACLALENGIHNAVSKGALVMVASHTAPQRLKPSKLLHLDNGKRLCCTNHPPCRRSRMTA